jgi:hypothetical protein
MDNKNSLVLWFTAIETLRAKGALICPLMLQEAGRYDPSLTPCDIPHTRETFLQSRNGPCHSSVRCLPRVHLPDQIGSELERKQG